MPAPQTAPEMGGRGCAVALVLFLLLILAVGFYGGYYAYTRINRSLEDLEGMFVTPVPRTNPEGTPEPTPNPLREPLYLAVLGVDLRDDEIPRSDTLILVNLDPIRERIALLSIPRDLWVTIPGYGESRINAAYAFGERDNYRGGGGPVLVKETVEHNFGIPVHAFVQVDFRGFERIVDALGGVTLDVEYPLADVEYPTENYGYTRLYVPVGLQHLNGAQALRYARSRHADSDFGRNRRQQQVLLALRDQALRKGVIRRLPQLVAELSDAVKTDLTPQEVRTLILLAPRAQGWRLETYAITPDMTQSWTTPQGAYVLLPRWDRIEPVLQAFVNGPDPYQKAREEAARIEVRNGTFVPGLAARTADELRRQGLQVVSIAQDPQAGNYPRTVLYVYNEAKAYTVDYLKTLLDLPNLEVRKVTAESPTVDLVLILGEDFALPTREGP